MRIRIGSHTLTRAEERGTNETEIRDVLSTGFSIPQSMVKWERQRFMSLTGCEGESTTNRSELKCFLPLRATN